MPGYDIPPKYQAIIDRYTCIFPVPLVSIAKDLGIEIYETKDFEDIQSGSLSKEGDKFICYLNSSHPNTRKYFTLAHEIGHFIFDQDYFDRFSEIVDTIKPRLNRSGEVQCDAELRKMDIRANNFAADLVMPKKEFETKYKECADIKDVARFFGVSEAAAVIRADRLKLFDTYIA